MSPVTRGLYRGHANFETDCSLSWRNMRRPPVLQGVVDVPARSFPRHVDAGTPVEDKPAGVVVLDEHQVGYALGLDHDDARALPE